MFCHSFNRLIKLPKEKRYSWADGCLPGTILGAITCVIADFAIRSKSCSYTPIGDSPFLMGPPAECSCGGVR